MLTGQIQSNSIKENTCLDLVLSRRVGNCQQSKLPETGPTQTAKLRNQYCVQGKFRKANIQSPYSEHQTEGLQIIKGSDSTINDDAINVIVKTQRNTK
ncbi:hypothetical protein DERP_003320 [Dermatophagoides pteronyssinus]|uniref:Uncharacterized protein n=1 Tax=Dermatophagoides pteronyssinus TaxID=6956 RepID=A0ABQ8JJN5_DERPT|nr:hypothetical protein DERP_003320 [Dermatophagoides pteronyssinus]